MKYECKKEEICFYENNKNELLKQAAKLGVEETTTKDPEKITMRI